MTLNLRGVRGELSQTEAARRIGVSQAQWSRWEGGDPPPPLVRWCLADPAIARRLLHGKELLLPPPQEGS